MLSKQKNLHLQLKTIIYGHMCDMQYAHYFSKGNLTSAIARKKWFHGFQFDFDGSIFCRTVDFYLQYHVILRFHFMDISKNSHQKSI